MAKEKFDERKFYEESLRDILGDDEDALISFMDDTVHPMMHLQYINMGSTGFAQVGTEDYYEKQEFEKQFLLKRIPELIGQPPEDTKLAWRSFPHDFGEYHEMCLLMDESKNKHWEYLNEGEMIDWDALEEEIQLQWIQEHSAPEDVSHLIYPDKIK